MSTCRRTSSHLALKTDEVGGQIVLHFGAVEPDKLRKGERPSDRERGVRTLVPLLGKQLSNAYTKAGLCPGDVVTVMAALGRRRTHRYHRRIHSSWGCPQWR